MVGIVNEYRHFLPARHPKFLVTVTQEVAKKRQNIVIKCQPRKWAGDSEIYIPFQF